jgi:prepilin-type N-terminal cleavage/methylation domain-containing protein
MRNSERSGFTIIEIVVAVALFGMLTLAFMYFMDPLSLLVKARNTRRQFHLQTLMNAIRENIADGRSGTVNCAAGDIPTSSKKMASGGASGTYDIAPCLVPVFVQALPFDPTAPGAHFTGVGDYDTGYFVIINGSGTVTLSAPSGELNQVVTYSFSTLKGQ